MTIFKRFLLRNSKVQKVLSQNLQSWSSLDGLKHNYCNYLREVRLSIPQPTLQELPTWLRNAEIKNALPDCVVRIFGQCPYTNGHSRQKQTFITKTILTWWVVELGYLLLHDIWHYMCVWARVSPQNRNSKHETILYFATDLYLSPPLPDPTYKFICVF